jgi:hypothetical protein
MRRAAARSTVMFLSVALAAVPGAPPPVAAGAVTAVAGPNQVVADGAPVTLDASRSADRAGRPLRFDWYQFRGPDVKLRGADRSKPTFVAPRLNNNTPVTLGFRLAADAGDGKPSLDDVYVIVLHKNAAPSARIEAPGAADRGDAVVVSAAASTDPDHDDLRFLWTQTDGPAVRFAGVETARTVITFGPLPRGWSYPYRVSLRCRVTDGAGASTVDDTVMLVDDAFQKTLKGLGLKTPDPAPNLLAQQMEWGRADARRARVSAVLSAELDASRAAQERGDAGVARGAALTALGIDPASKEARDAAVGLDDAEEMSFAGRLRKGHAAFVERDYLAALRAYGDAAQTRPANKVTPELSAACLSALELQSARPTPATHSARAAAHDPAGSHQLYTEGLVYYASGRLREAVDTWKRAVDLDRDNKFAINAYQRVLAELPPR